MIQRVGTSSISHLQRLQKLRAQQEEGNEESCSCQENEDCQTVTEGEEVESKERLDLYI